MILSPLISRSAPVPGSVKVVAGLLPPLGDEARSRLLRVLAETAVGASTADQAFGRIEEASSRPKLVTEGTAGDATEGIEGLESFGEGHYAKRWRVKGASAAATSGASLSGRHAATVIESGVRGSFARGKRDG